MLQMRRKLWGQLHRLAAIDCTVLQLELWRWTVWICLPLIYDWKFDYESASTAVHIVAWLGHFILRLAAHCQTAWWAYSEQGEGVEKVTLRMDLSTLLRAMYLSGSTADRYVVRFRFPALNTTRPSMLPYARPWMLCTACNMPYSVQFQGKVPFTNVSLDWS